MGRDLRYMSRMSELLIFHKIITHSGELTDDIFEDVVEAFQEKVDILVDGDPGPETLWRLQEPWTTQQHGLLFVRCAADIVPGVEGFDQLLLREDAAERYRALKQDVNDLGGVVTTAGGKRPLNADVNTNRSAKSMHYSGLAFDLAVTSGFFKPETDPYVISRTDDGGWTVWCRASEGKERSVKAVWWSNWNSGKDLSKRVTDRFVNFTELCAAHGFAPIKPRKPFTRLENRKYLASEWWHFQAADLLIPNLSQFGIELLRIEDYTAESICSASENIWANRKAIFQKQWF